MSRKILVIDHNQDILDQLRVVLTAQGYKVHTLVYTVDILQDVAAIQPGLVILDFLQAGINGGELCAEIRRNTATSTLPVLILSAYPRVLDSLGNYGQNAFMAKPFKIDKLLDRVGSFVSELLSA